MRLSGSCLCGAVGFTLEGWVSPIQACHARRCRKATGALFVPEIAASSADFAWHGGPGRITTYTAEVLHEPPAYQRNLCSTCGSPLPVVIEDAGMVILNAGCLDEGPDIEVFRLAFVEQKSPAVKINDGKPQFEGQPPAPDPSVLLR